MSFKKIKGFDFKRLVDAVNAQIPVIMETSANTAKNHFLKSFRDGGFTDNVLERWTPRKSKDKRKGRRAILVKSGHLRDSIRVARTSNKGFLIVSDMGLGANSDYAPVHNFGLRAGRGRGFKMPKRQFIGRSKTLEERIKQNLIKKINAILNK